MLCHHCTHHPHLADIQTGQGLYFQSLTKSWRAQNCDSAQRPNTYGVSNTTFGLTPAACTPCPQFMVTSRSSNYSASAKHFVSNPDGTGGFASVEACVTQPGVCVSGRALSMKAGWVGGCCSARGGPLVGCSWVELWQAVAALKHVKKS